MLFLQTANRDSMSLNYESKKSEGRELHAAIDDLNKRRDQRMKDIAKLQKDLQVFMYFELLIIIIILVGGIQF